MIVTVDYDLKGDFRDTLFSLRLSYLCRPGSPCRVWRTRKGYHVALWLREGDVEKALFLRLYLLDDIYRFAYDFARLQGLGAWSASGVIYDVKYDNGQSVAVPLQDFYESF